MPQPKVRALEASNGLQVAQQALAVDPRCYVVPDPMSDQPWRTAMYGRVARIGPISGDKAGPYFEQRYDVEEIPGIVPGT